MAALRRNFGIGEPVRRGMEIKIAREGEWRPMALGGSAGVSGDILVGRDAEITWEDVYTGMFFFSLPVFNFAGPRVIFGMGVFGDEGFADGGIQGVSRGRVRISMRRWRGNWGWIGEVECLTWVWGK